MPEQAGGYSIGWLTLSLINAGLAQSKGRSGLIWWLLSLLLGPIATFLIVLSPQVAPGSRGSDWSITRTQALIIGAVVLLVIAGILGVAVARSIGV